MPCKDKIKKKEYQKIYYKNNKERLRRSQKEYYSKYPEIKKEIDKKYYKKNKIKLNKRRRIRWNKYYKNNKKKESIRKKLYYLKNKDKIKKREVIYREKNKGKIKVRHKFWYQENKKEINVKAIQCRKDTKRKIRFNISALIREKLKRRLLGKKGKSTFSFLPYTVDDLIRHLESLFKKGMNWTNYGDWHIDHIKPDCKFDYKNVEDEEFQKCWALENLQPLWAEENWIKNKY